jgi:DNA repair exonuclease SbcCD ATPase subunit
MITFKSITYKNFLSVGDIPVTIYLNRSDTTLVTGTNGNGKSTFADAITFGLFGKSYRGIKKNNLINNINKSGTLVTIDFDVGSDNFIVIRGIKPEIFEIHKNGVLIEEDAAVRDYQGYLEKYVIKQSYRTFCQVSILGAANYIPFMLLKGDIRREVTETLFGANVFSTMNRVLKSKATEWKRVVSEIRQKIETLDSTIDMRKRHIQTLQKSNDEILSSKKSKIGEIRRTIESLQSKISEISNRFYERWGYPNDMDIHTIVSSLAKHNNEINDSLVKEKRELSFVEQDIHKIEKKMKSLEQSENKECPSCYQKISHDHVSSCNSSMGDELSKLKIKSDSYKENIEKINVSLLSKVQELDEAKSVNSEIEAFKRSIESSKQVGLVLVEEVKQLAGSNTVDALEKEKDQLKIDEGIKRLLVKDYTSLINQEVVYKHCTNLLKDSGIKQVIINQYLPILNQRVNFYLSILNFNVKFSLDSNFDETLKSRNMTELEYLNFSQGERQRIDLALMFAWRDIASMKNSVSSNLLILDEVGDSSLDERGVDDLLVIIESLKNTNVFIVSHRSNFEDKMNSIIRFEKVNGFSKMSKI